MATDSDAENALAHTRRPAMARRHRYAELRRAGVPVYEAGRQAGVHDTRTAQRYERWYQSGLLGDVAPEP